MLLCSYKQLRNSFHVPFDVHFMTQTKIKLSDKVRIVDVHCDDDKLIVFIVKA